MWAAGLAQEQALIDCETVEAQEGREQALEPFLASGYALEQAEQALAAVNRQPSGRPTPSIQMDSNGGLIRSVSSCACCKSINLSFKQHG